MCFFSFRFISLYLYFRRPVRFSGTQYLLHQRQSMESESTVCTTVQNKKNVGNFGMFSYGFQFLASYINSLTLQAVSIQQLLAFLVHFDPALRTAHTLAGDAPQQTLALVAVGGRGGSPHLKIVWRGAGDGVDQSLQSLLVHMVFLLN